ADDVEECQAPARLHDPAETAVQARFVGDVHGGVLRPGDIEAAGRERQGGGVALDDVNQVRQTGPPGEFVAHVHELGQEVHAGHPAPVGPGKVAGRANDTAAGVEDVVVGADARGLRQGGRRHGAQRVELLQHGEIVGADVLGIFARGGQGGEDPG